MEIITALGIYLAIGFILANILFAFIVSEEMEYDDIVVVLLIIPFWASFLPAIITNYIYGKLN